MLDKTRKTWASVFFAATLTLCAGSPTIAQDSDWRVSRSSGEVWFTTSGAQPVALTSNVAVKAGSTVRTGQNGRVLLVRGAETMLISANSVISLPATQDRGMSTTVLQQAGTVLLEVEKRNVQHFEVATPYLAAVVKGTKFEVTVSATGSQVTVSSGQVQVSEFKSGKYALVNQGQIAQVSSDGSGDLSLSGRGTLGPVQQGTPRGAPVDAIVIPSDGFAAPDLKNGQRVASAETDQQAQPAGSSAPSHNANDSGWVSGVVNWGKGVLGITNRRNGEDSTLMLALIAFVGVSVTAGAAVFRRRPKKKDR